MFLFIMTQQSLNKWVLTRDKYLLFRLLIVLTVKAIMKGVIVAKYSRVVVIQGGCVLKVKGLSWLCSQDVAIQGGQVLKMKR